MPLYPSAGLTLSYSADRGYAIFARPGFGSRRVFLPIPFQSEPVAGPRGLDCWRPWPGVPSRLVVPVKHPSRCAWDRQGALSVQPFDPSAGRRGFPQARSIAMRGSLAVGEESSPRQARGNPGKACSFSSTRSAEDEGEACSTVALESPGQARTRHEDPNPDGSLRSRGPR